MRTVRAFARSHGFPSSYCFSLHLRSRHRPLAVTEGSLTKNLNKIGVRVWTESSFDQHGEIRHGDALDAITHRADRRTGPDQRRGAIGAAEPHPAAIGMFQFDEQRRALRAHR